MSRMAEYVRIFTTGADDTFVEKRLAAAEGMKETFAGWSQLQAVEFVSGLSKAKLGIDRLPEAIAIGGEKLIQQHASSFVRSAEEGDLQIGVVFCAAVMDVLEQDSSPSGWDTADAFAASLWSALSFQSSLEQDKVEIIRRELLGAARSRVMIAADKSRQRRNVPPIGAVNISQETSAGSRVNSAFSKAVEPMVSALKENAALDREELDFLWWLLADYSEMLAEPYGGMPNEVRAVVAGYDAASKVRRVPSDAHRNLALRGIVEGQPLSLAEILTNLGERRGKLATKLSIPAGDFGSVFPLSVGIVTGEAHELGGGALSPREWGARALLEGSILRLLNGGAGEL